MRKVTAAMTTIDTPSFCGKSFRMNRSRQPQAGQMEGEVGSGGGILGIRADFQFSIFILQSWETRRSQTTSLLKIAKCKLEGRKLSSHLHSKGQAGISHKL